MNTPKYMSARHKSHIYHTQNIYSESAPTSGNHAVPPPHLADVFLDQLGADHPDEAGVCPVGHGARTQRLACTGRAEQKHALRRLNTEVHEPLRLSERGGRGGRGGSEGVRWWGAESDWGA